MTMRMRTMRMRLSFAAMAILATAAVPTATAADAAVAESSTPDFPDFFNAEAMRRPLPGEWMEYRVAFPTDQLENSLRADAEDAEISDIRQPDFVPAFDAPPMWRVLPLRLEIREVTEDGANAILTFGGMTHEMFLPKTPGDAPDAEFTYDPPKEGEGADRRIFIQIGNEAGAEDIEVETIRRVSGDAEGFIRWTNADLPFGLARLATPDVDFLLVARGRGTPPAFPLPDPVTPDPPLGKLWGGDQ